MIVICALVACFAQIKIAACVAMVPGPFNRIALTQIALIIVVYFLTVFSPIFVFHGN